jgi:hypothetical protein
LIPLTKIIVEKTHVYYGDSDKREDYIK